ncbi:MAG: PAS domain S-box protein, partial [Terriglobia bacterium]
MGRAIFERRKALRFRAWREFFDAEHRGGFWLFAVLLGVLAWGLLRGAQETQLKAARRELPTVRSLPTLTHIEQIRGLAPEEAGRDYPVRIRAVVTYCHVDDGDLFIQDSTAGVWVDPKKLGLNLRSGQLVEVEGTTGVGDFSPEIDNARVQILGEAPLPAPRRVSGDELASGRQDSQWVEVEAVVRSAAERGTDLTLNASAGAFQFRVFIPDYGTPPDDLVDSVVRIRGVFGGTYTLGGLFTGFQVLVPSRSGIQTVRRRSGGLFSLPVRPIHLFLRLTPVGAFTHRVRVQGTVTYQGSEFLCIRDQDAALLIRLGMPSTQVSQDTAPRPSGSLTSLKVGDLVDVVGFPDRGEYTPVMRDAVFRRIGVRSPPQPAKMSVKQALQGDHDADLVRLSARLLNRTNREGQEVLELQEEDTTFRAEMEKQNGSPPLDSLRPGSLLELTGIRRIEVDENRVPRAFSLLLRSPGDVVVLKRPPWWSVRKVLAALAMLMAAVVAVLGWVAVLRRRVRSQTELIRQRLESEAALAKRYQRLFERNLAGVCRTSLDGRLLDCNEALATMLGYGSREELLGRQTSRTLLAQADREAFLLELKAENKLSNREMRLERRDGSGLWVIENATLVDDADGRCPVIESTYIDITERKRAEEALAGERNLLRTLIDNLPDFIFVKDSQSRMLINNIAHRRLLGAGSEDEVKGKTDFDFFSPELARHYYADDQAVTLSGRPLMNREETTVDRDGNSQWLLTTKVPWFGRDGKIAGIVGMCRNITERKQLELELRHSQKLEAVGGLASGIAHELNTPIQFVGDNTHFLQDAFRDLAQVLEKHHQVRVAAARGAVPPALLDELAQAEALADVDYLQKEIPKALEQSLDGVTRVATIVRAMKEFAHPDRSEKMATDLNKS